MLIAKGIKRKYGSLEVLKGVDININQGEIVSIVGSSGAGKSTLLHILSTLDNADAGDVFINNLNVTKLKGNKLAHYRNLHLGFIFQFHHLLPEFSALENVSIPAWIANKNKKDVKKEATKMLELLGLGERLNNKPQEMSGGEQQRVAVARALINKPEIVFADEPTGNLDSNNAQSLHHLFVELKDTLKQTFLIVTHNEELARMSDRIIHMKDGLTV